MFTGLIREVGRVAALTKRGREAELVCDCALVLEDAGKGDSIAVDGACVTVERLSGVAFSAYLSPETLGKTTLGGLKPGDRVNLEASLRPADRLGGHLVQGHVEGVGRVLALEKGGHGARLSVEVPPDLMPFVIPKGSIALGGVSLTVASMSGRTLDVAVVPSTLAGTTMASWKPGHLVNVETDVVGRYIVSYLRGLREPRALTLEDLIDKGY